MNAKRANSDKTMLRSRISNGPGAIRLPFVDGLRLPSELAREQGIAEGTMRMRVLRGMRP